MSASITRWRQVTPSQHAWEAEAMERLRVLLPETDPYYAWTNFEFTDGGRISEADALVITPKGVFLIEIKSWSGRVAGDQGQWVQRRRDGSVESFRNPASTNAAKVRSLASLIKRNWSPAATRDGVRAPFIQSLVWFSNPTLEVALPPELRPHIAIADNKTVARNIQTLSEAILEIGAAESDRTGFERITAKQADAFAATMDRIGLKESTRRRTAGSYELQLPAFAERGSTQDFMAKHKVHGLQARVRIYSNVADASPEDAKALRDAATREYMATQNLRIDGVVHALDSDITEFGPAVIFEHHPKAVRLDRFMAERDSPLELDAALDMIEQLAGTVRQMHRRRISHRMLTPESVWLRPAHTETPGVTTWDALVSDFSLASRENTNLGTTAATYTRVGSLPTARTGALEVVLGDPAAETYLAPEAFTDANADGVALDVFSIGALTYLLCIGRPPAAGRADLRTALGSGGLSLEAALPEVDPALAALVRSCTTPIVSERLGTMSEVIDAIAMARSSINGQVPDTEPDPLVAVPGDVLGVRFEVKRRLGKGSTAVALWCHDLAHDRDVVLKVSLGVGSDDRLAAEAEALANLRHQNVVTLHETVEVGGRNALVLSFAGERSLAGYLREEGSVSTEFLRRWGEDLLEAVRFIEKAGVAHRDLKPDNLGIVEMGPHKKSHLVLFDFSLAGTKASDLLAGTPPYLDPFLGDEGRGRFDLAAERYAAAVTIHEMATGEPPTWGDGQTDPAYLPGDVEATLLVEGIDPEVRAPVSEFLSRSLRRDPGERFDTADDMARAWIAAFAAWESSESADSADDANDDEGEQPTFSLLSDTLTLADPITALPASRKVRSSLRKLNALTIADVAALDPISVNQSRGVSVKTRKVVLRLRAAVLERFAEELAGSAPQSANIADDSAVEPDGPGTAIADTSPVIPAIGVALGRPDLDQLGLFLVPPRGSRGRAGSVAETVRRLLGLDLGADDHDGDDDWPTITAVAKQMGTTSGAVSASFQKARAHWSRFPELMAVADDLLAILADVGGVAGVSELVEPLLEIRASGNDPVAARRLSVAVLRAVLDSGAPAAERFSLRRYGRRTIVAINGPAVAAAAVDGSGRLFEDDDPAKRFQLAGFNPATLTDLAVALGKRADELVDAATVVSSADAVPALRAVRSEVGKSLSDARLVRLAVAASGRAASNAASDLVVLDASPVDALRWSRTSLIGSAQLSLHELATRVASRFPAATLPGRPELDDALIAAGLPFSWSDAAHAYVSNASGPGNLGQLTVAGSRQGTVFSKGGTTVTPEGVIAPEIAAAFEIDERLGRSIRAGGFLALRVPTDRLADARRNLARFQTSESAMVTVDLEGLFLRHLRAIAEQRRIAWTNLEGADDRDDRNWKKLSIFAGDAVEATIAEVVALDRVMAWFPGALVRHAPAGRPAPLDQLRDAAMSAEHPLHTLWLVVLGSTADALPLVDGAPVPTLGAGQWLDLSDTWLRNTHRAGGLTA